MRELTNVGKLRIASYARDCAKFRKRLLDNGTDTGNLITYPSRQMVIQHFKNAGASNFDADGNYHECWNVSDNYGLDLYLHLDKDFVVVL